MFVVGYVALYDACLSVECGSAAIAVVLCCLRGAVARCLCDLPTRPGLCEGVRAPPNRPSPAATMELAPACRSPPAAERERRGDTDDRPRDANVPVRPMGDPDRRRRDGT